MLHDLGRLLDDLDAEQAVVDADQPHGVTLRAGLSLPCTGLHEVPRGYAEAHRALAQVGGGGVVALSEVALFDYLVGAADATLQRLIAPELRRFLADEVLVETVAAYLDADLNVQAAADRLTVHANTVHYRLRKVTELTGRSTRSFRDLLELLTAARATGMAAPAEGR